MVSRQDHALGMAQEARARLEEFVADAAHELHTPVTSVVGWSDLLGSGDLNDESTATAIRRIGEEARRLADLVDDLATLAWMDVGPVAMVDRVALAPLINDAIADAVAADATRKIEARISAVPDVDGRSGDLRRVVDNLLRNVRSHTPAGTRVLVTLDLVSDGVVLEVADDGPGFPPSSVDRVFDRFWRADPSRTRASGGSGLGLAIVGSIVRAHGGEVAASRSRLGGAAVTVRLSPTGSSMSGGTVPPGDPSCDA